MSNQECLDSFNSEIKRLLEEPMRWVGMYIAAASAACVLAMAADLFDGFRNRRFWFRCKYFSLNAFSLTLLAVSLKLPVDLTTDMFATCDWLAKLASLTFLLTALANFMPSIGSMTDQEILANVIALCVFIVTVVGNVFIQYMQLRKHVPIREKIMQRGIQIAAILILILLVAFVSLAIMVLTTKRLIDSKYKKELNAVLKKEGCAEVNNFKRSSKIYWVMAETGSPQFVIARSVVCTASSTVSLLLSLSFTSLLVTLAIINWSHPKIIFVTGSMYGWSTRCILGIQSVGVIVGSVAPTFRLFSSLRYQSFDISLRLSKKNISEIVCVEKFWIQKLEQWRDSSLDLQIGNLTCIKYLHQMKRIVLNIFIGLQILVVGVSKFMFFIFALPLSPFVHCFSRIHKLIHHEKNLSEDFTTYLLLLEGEAKLPYRTLKRICSQPDLLIKRGRRNQLENLFSLLHNNMSGDFNGVREFDNIQISSLFSQEPLYFWALPLVTLASVAIALPNIPKDKTKKLVLSVNEGLPLAKLVDMASDVNKEFSNIRRAVDAAWVGVAYYRKWLHKDLKDSSLRCRDSKYMLQYLSEKADTIIVDFKKDAGEFLMANPDYWPFEVIAANAMYRISQTVLTWDWSDDEALFDRLTVTIADVTAACLTNLERVIIERCHQNAIEERERSIHEALLLYGKTERILRLLHKKKSPCIDPNKAIYVKEWRTNMLQYVKIV